MPLAELRDRVVPAALRQPFDEGKQCWRGWEVDRRATPRAAGRGGLGVIGCGGGDPLHHGQTIQAGLAQAREGVQRLAVRIRFQHAQRCLVHQGFDRSAPEVVAQGVQLLMVSE